jgi:hypothetical protein
VLLGIPDACFYNKISAQVEEYEVSFNLFLSFSWQKTASNYKYAYQYSLRFEIEILDGTQKKDSPCAYFSSFSSTCRIYGDDLIMEET